MLPYKKWIFTTNELDFLSQYSQYKLYELLKLNKNGTYLFNVDKPFSNKFGLQFTKINK